MRNGRTKYLAVDHDHRTGRIRGLLCERHNIGIGNFKDGVVELRAAIEYLTGAAAEDDLHSATPRPSLAAVRTRREGFQLTLLDRSRNAGDWDFYDVASGRELGRPNPRLSLTRRPGSQLLALEAAADLLVLCWW